MFGAMLFAATAAMQTAPWSPESIAAAEAIKARNVELRTEPDERGCIGADAVTCIASMGFYVYISSTRPGLGGYGELKLPRPVEHDIHGQPVPQMVSFLVTFAPGVTSIAQPDAIHVDLYLGDGARVSSVQFMLPTSPLSAKTQGDWEATRVFELSTAAMGAKCIGPDRMEFYRLYDKIQRGKSSESTGSDYSDPGVFSGVFGRTTVCGVSMEAITSGGISARAGTYSGSMLTFEAFNGASATRK